MAQCERILQLHQVHVLVKQQQRAGVCCLGGLWVVDVLVECCALAVFYAWGLGLGRPLADLAQLLQLGRGELAWVVSFGVLGGEYTQGLVSWQLTETSSWEVTDVESHSVVALSRRHTMLQCYNTCACHDRQGIVVSNQQIGLANPSAISLFRKFVNITTQAVTHPRQLELHGRRLQQPLQLRLHGLAFLAGRAHLGDLL